MPKGQYPGPLHPRRTERSGYEYYFYDKHHKAGYSEDAQWLPEMTHDEEFAVFNLADSHELSNEKGDLYGLRLSAEGNVLILGTREAQVAEFPLSRKGIMPGMAIPPGRSCGWTGSRRNGSIRPRLMSSRR